MYARSCPRSKFLIGESDLEAAFDDKKKQKKKKAKGTDATTSAMTLNSTESEIN